MSKSSKRAARSGGAVVSITSIGEAGGVPVEGALVDAENLEEAVESTVSQMDWLTDTDRAMVELALSYARQIDMVNMTAVAAADQIKTLSDDTDPEIAAALLDSANKALAASSRVLYLGPHLHNTLKALGGDPMARKEITGADSGNDEAPVDPLAAMRAQARERRHA